MSHYSGDFAFMQDDALDMALKVLAPQARRTRPRYCNRHLLRYANMYSKRSRLQRKTFCAVRRLQLDPHALNDGIMRAFEIMEQYKPQIKSERKEGENSTQDIHGSHWSLFTIDWIHKVIRYIDGRQTGNAVWLCLAQKFASNMLHAIGKPDDPRWRVVEEVDGPKSMER